MCRQGKDDSGDALVESVMHGRMYGSVRITYCTRTAVVVAAQELLVLRVPPDALWCHSCDLATTVRYLTVSALPNLVKSSLARACERPGIMEIADLPR